MKNEIKVRCKGSDEITLDELIVIQGDLKDLSEENFNKLKNQMLELGFIAPFFIWKNGEEKCLIDGTQRCCALKLIREAGETTLPENYPIVEIEADNLKEAKRMILAVSSNYGEMTSLSLEGFLLDAEIDLDDASGSFNFDAINFNDMIEVFDPIEEASPGDSTNGDKKYELEISFPNDMEMMDIHDDLTSRGYMVKIK